MASSDDDKVSRLRSAIYSRKIAPSFGALRRRGLSPQETDTPRDWMGRNDAEPVSGTTVAPRAIRYARRALWWTFGIALLFFLIAMGAFAWYVFGGFGTDVRSSNVDIQVSGPLSVVGGEPAELQIVVTNKNKAPLQYANLVVDYPAGTRSVTDLSSDLPEQRISLGTIDAGGTRQGTVNAVLIGAAGSSGAIHVSVEYQVAGASATFTASKEYDFTFAASPVSISVDSDTQAVSGQPITLTATVSANSNTILRDVLLQLEPPFGFTLAASDPAPSSADVWDLGDLRPGDTRTVTLNGTLEGQPGDTRVFTFDVGTKSATTTGVAIPLTQFAQDVAIAQPFIGLTMGVDGVTASTTTVVRPGSSVAVTINWKNQLTTPITNAVFVASLDGFPIAGNTIQTQDGFYRSADNTVQWNADTSHGALATLAPGASGSVSFSFSVPADADLATLRNPTLNISLHASGDRADESNVPQNLQSSVVRTIKVETTPSVIAQGFYHTNPFGVSGSVPPTVNKETTYAILWSASNSTNPVSNAVLTAQLPPYVRWTGVYAPGSEDITFNQKTGVVTWNIGSIPAGAGEGGSSPRQVSFEVGFTPSSSQIGQTPALITNQVFTGIDSFTNTKLSDHLPDTTTSQLNDPGFVPQEAVVVQ